MGLTRPIDEWPLLICGPILRRVTESEVAVFAATKVVCDVQVTVAVAGAAAPGWASDVVRTRTLGISLHVVVCRMQAPAADSLAPGVVYEYDLRMTPTDTGVTETLADQPGLLSGAVPLGYVAGAVPTFALPPGLNDLNLLHSSCRKPHGGGPDALAMADQLVFRARAAPTPAAWARSRPHQLLLTGDQIYADDVALTMLATLQEAGALLCAQAPEELFPTGGVPMSSALVRPGTARQSFLAANTKLSSDYGMNHLMYFAEFCAMYVMCWSDEIWPRDANGRLLVGTAAVDPELARQNQDERCQLIDFVRTLRRVRRVLANVPTTMMFDDHEISDDWNLDGEWAASSQTDPGLRRVVRNGLLAFAAFQGWGNDAAQFESGVGKALLDLITVPAGATAPPLTATPGAADVALKLSIPPGMPAQQMTWSWTIDGPEHRVIALDSRTSRDYVSRGPDRPGLLTTAELDRQLTAHLPGAGDDRLCVVIAPAPVVGHPLVEQTLQPGLALVQGGRAADNEAWCVNSLTYQSVLRRLADFRRVVVLSGDVHYAYSNHTAYFGAEGQAPGRIVQLCSSAAKNADGKTRAIQFGAYLGKVEEGWLGFADPLAPGLARLLSDSFGPSSPTTVDSVPHNLWSRIQRFKLFATPAVVPAGPWRHPVAFLAVKARVDQADPRDWRYKVFFCEDRRSGTARLATALEINPRPAGAGAGQVIRGGHRFVVGEPNLGQVRLDEQAGRPVVVHRLHWMTSSDPANGVQTVTEHVLPLDAPGQDERPVPFLL